MANTLYPPSPSPIRYDLVVPTSSYKTRIAFMLLGIVAFFVIYFLMVYGSIQLFLYCLDPGFQGHWLIYFGTIAVSAMLMVFTIKFLFKRHGYENPMNIELKETEPGAFDCIFRG